MNFSSEVVFEKAESEIELNDAGTETPVRETHPLKAYHSRVVSPAGSVQ